MITHRYHTRVCVVVDSHASREPIEISRDVISLNCGKQTKTVGRWQMQLVPRRNYINLVYPNDVVNIYIDPGDGTSGFVRTMFGYVDRVERAEKVSEKGDVSTRITIVGSDFQKAVDKTSMYFNAYMRQVLDERFARSDQGRLRTTFRNDAEGSSLRNAGITAHGTPADFIENFLMLILGFGQQWRLPNSYKRAQQQIQENRDKRSQRAMGRIPQVVLDAIDILGFKGQKLTDIVEDVIKKAAEASREADVNQVDAISGGAIQFSEELRVAAKTLTSSAALLAYRNVRATSDASYPNGILDLISFDFIEALCIDGFQANAAVWQAGNQTLSQFLYGNSNGDVNELIFDLRPISPEGGLEEGDYSFEDDELGINAKGSEAFAKSAGAVRYQPAVVFREYPYSVVEGVDLSSLARPAPAPPAVNSFSPAALQSSFQAVIDAVDLKTTYETFVPFGPIFSVNVNKEGRAIYKYATPLHPAAKQFNDKVQAQARKHIDVVVITNSDVKDASVGRSDEDTINVFQLGTRSSADMTTQMTSVLTNFSPVVNQISIARNGLRLWEGQTQFANWSPQNIEGIVGGSKDNSQIRRNLVRWQLMMDHWNQHNIEYLSGTITVRGRPDIRVGYRLDWEERRESYYVEAVQHQWAFPGAMTTSLSVSRGQRNDPFLAYIPPVYINDAGQTEQQVSGNRGETGRLAKFFKVKDTDATRSTTDGEGPQEAELGANTTDQYPDVIINGGIAVLSSTTDIGVETEYGSDKVELVIPNRDGVVS